MMRRVLAIGALVACSGIAAQAYLKLGSDIGAEVVALRWKTFPVRYQVTSRDVANVTAMDLQGAIARAFATWGAVPGSGIRSEFLGFSSREPFIEDDVSVIGFRPRPDLDRVLGATTFSIDESTGAILDADIFLNSSFQWSVSGQPSRFDVESIALHEIGHLLGLGHSALGETELMTNGNRRVVAKRAVMFPIAFPSGTTLDRTLNADDVAGIEDTYVGTSSTEHGSISGRVRLNGRGVFGAHVTALNTRTAALVASFTLDKDGRFVIAGLEPGIYAVRAEPLDDADLDGFFDDASGVEINFTPAFSTSLAIVPARGTSNRIDIVVKAK
jgi:hypothetical protein